MFERNLYSQREQQVFERLREIYGVNVPISKSYLRAEATIKNNKSQYDFNFVTQGASNELPTRLLKVTDGFYALAVQMYLVREPDIEAGFGSLQTYVNETLFPAVAGFNPDDLAIFYNGLLQIQINQSIVYDGIQTELFKVAPQFQQNSATTVSEKHPSDGMQELTPNLRLAGTQKITASVLVPTWSGIEIESVTAGVSNKLILGFDGFYIPNGSDIFQKEI